MADPPGGWYFTATQYQKFSTTNTTATNAFPSLRLMAVGSQTTASHVLEGGEGGVGGVRRGGGGGGSGWDTPPPRVSGKKMGKIFFFLPKMAMAPKKNENLWDIITSKNMPLVGFEPTTCRPAVHCSTTHLPHRTA